MTAFGVVSAASLTAVAVLMTGTALVARRVGRVSVVDVTWGLGFVAVAIVCAAVAPALGVGDEWRGWLLAGLVAAWGGRLAWSISRHHARKPGEDPRYAALLGDSPGDGGFGRAVRRVFLVQGAAMWVVSLPLQVAAAAPVRWSWLVAAGVLVWLVGLGFEAVGDAQLAAYRRRPERPPILDDGLWGWTRHPNYFGDATVWWGLWLAGSAASGWLPGLLTVVAPVAMTYFLLHATGADLLERTMMERPGYREYAARVPKFFPRPPRPVRQ